VESITKTADKLAAQLSLDPSSCQDFILKQLQLFGLLGVEIAYSIECGSEGMMFRLEDETLKLLDFIYSICDYPFLIEGG